ncbi:LacI family transcriptional regulator [Tsukamurella pulmonis]|uniref:Transcriptional regulator, LacI family n=2 Tax=Tsukamurella pulmonis TaxID=47312 RepID=A0A1H1C6K2_9ACTN|nr:LacI family transcriptional regulator [Tsukamurella pulmonis]SDQ59832.1 transcriptional regulator, LacI family [Tsukamurella pulmonis]SUP24144.1 Purine nucleotide synthesis repressor [Tsukamurella pulmonis]
MADVAAAAGVSISTVSHVINETRRVDPRTRDAVLAAIAATGYRRNALAAALATSRSGVLALSIAAGRNPYFGPLMRAIESRASELGYTLMMGDSHDDTEIEYQLVGSLLDRRVDGLIIAPAPDSERRAIPAIAATGTPVVLIDRLSPADVDQVASEGAEPVARLTTHLVERGHRHIGVLTGRPGIQSTEERIEGFRDAMAAAGLRAAPRHVRCGDSRADEAHTQTLAIFGSRAPQPTALVVLNNEMTVGALRALRDLDLRVPDDVALVAYDDFEWSDLFSPGLTAAAQDVEAIGRRCVDLLVDRIGGFDGPRRVERLPTAFHHRDSCGCERARAGG